MSWILGELASNRLDTLASIYQSRKLAEASDRYAASFSKYAPWMSNNKAYYDPKIHKEPKDSDGPFYFCKSYIRHFESFFSDLDEPILFVRSEGQRIFLYPNILDEYPESRATFKSSWTILLESSGWIRKVSEALVKQILPIKGLDRARGYSVSSNLLVGTIFMALPAAEDEHSELDLAINFAHEIGHQALILLQNADPILASSFTAPIYSGIRKTERPAIMSLHSAVALGYMIEAAKNLLLMNNGSSSQFLTERLCSLKDSLESNLNAIKLAAKTTELGSRILADLEKCLTSKEPLA